MKKPLIVGVLVLVAAAVIFGLVRHSDQQVKKENELVLFGNVDLRQVELAFNDSERIASVLVEEGDRVKRGQVVARLDTARLRPQLEQAEAMVAAQQAAVQRLHRGSRPEEIAQADANVALAQASFLNAGQQWARVEALSKRSTGLAVSKQDLDAAKAALDTARARLTVAQKSRDLTVAGPRAEDIAQAEAELRGREAQVLLLRQQLADAELTAPSDAVVRSRLLEPGEMASPQRPVLSLAITDPKWVRAYVSETDLGKVHPGAAATVTADSFPGKTYSGQIGFISSVAEFTPKSVQTEDLRSNLVYEVRVFMQDPQDQLRLGMPVTVRIDLTKTNP